MAAAVTFFVLPGLSALRPPSDSGMVRDFRAHTAQFDELVDMLQQDAGITRIGPVGDWQQDINSPNTPPERVARYRVLMSELRIEAIDRAYEGLRLYRASFGLAVSGWAKGYVYSASPGPLTKGETADDAGDASAGEAWRPIEGDWYLWYSWD
jgi:hypothetical protein